MRTKMSHRIQKAWKSCFDSTLKILSFENDAYIFTALRNTLLPQRMLFYSSMVINIYDSKSRESTFGIVSITYIN